MRVIQAVLAVGVGLFPFAGAMAQDVDTPARTAFVGGHAGLEAGAVDHYFVIEVPPSPGPGYTARFGEWGVGAGAFAGYDLPIGDRIRIGVELGANVGGRSPFALFGQDTRYAQDPQWGYRVAGRAGYVIGDRTLAYATLGYGAQRYRIEDNVGIGEGNWRRNVAVGGGVEHRLTPRIGIRADYRSVIGVTHQIMVGVPVRF